MRSFGLRQISQSFEEGIGGQFSSGDRMPEVRIKWILMDFSASGLSGFGRIKKGAPALPRKPLLMPPYLPCP